MEKNIIYLLIGAKGSGKSFIGNLMDQTFGIKFVRVEDWAKKIRKGRNVDSNSYVKEVFQTIEEGIRNELLEHHKIVFESTGLTVYFDQMLKGLRTDFNVTTIGVEASTENCLERVKTRDRSIHIAIPEDEIIRINKLVKQRNIKCDYTMHNENKSSKELIAELITIIERDTL